MIPLIKVCFFTILAIMLSKIVAGQEPFNGSFLMSFKSDVESKNDFPMLWNIEKLKSGGRMVLEIQDEMQKKGISKRVMFNPSDSTWMMLMEYNLVKQGTRIKASKMFTDSLKQTNFQVIKKNEKNIIEGYKCKKITLESDQYFSEAWVTSDIKFNLGYMYKLLSHCGLMGEFVSKGDWFTYKNISGMVLEVTSKNKSTNQTYTMSISTIKPGIITESFFSTKGFKISDIPEGQSCGVSVKE